MYFARKPARRLQSIADSKEFDTAQSYGNEEALGSALKKSGIPREELFITTKVRPHYYDHAWSPLGHGRGLLFDHPQLMQIGEKYGKTPAQVILRWDLPQGVAAIPGSSRNMH